MTDFAAEGVYDTGGTNTLTERSGAVAATDTVPGGALVVARNTGAGTHTVVLTVNALFDGLQVPVRTHSLAAGTIKAFRVPNTYQDANGRVAIAVGEGTFAEVKYYVIGT
jgi:hypothetical protein